MLNVSHHSSISYANRFSNFKYCYDADVIQISCIVCYMLNITSVHYMYKSFHIIIYNSKIYSLVILDNKIEYKINNSNSSLNNI